MTGKRPRWNERDRTALTWIANQYAIRLDHLQVLLSRLSHRPVKLSAVRSVVTRWRNAGWVNSQRMRANERGWVSLTASALHALDLPYSSLDVDRCSLVTLKVWAAINEVRLHYEDEQMCWVSQRQLLAERRKTRVLPDAELTLADGRCIAIKVEHGYQESEVQSKWAMEFLRKPYSEVWYIAFLPEVRRQMRVVCARMLSLEEARRIVVKDDEVLREPMKPQVERVGRRRVRSRRRVMRMRLAQGEPAVIESMVEA
jgi:hypothetical protein